jgi:excinuclease ABC subunit A
MSTADDPIEVRGAREHNLQDVSITLPRNKLIVFTGVSGSGKSSLAFDTLYAEGQRRYIESLSAYARQFLGQLRKPDVDYLGGLSPSISIEQKTAGANPRSTVGTITEIHDYLRVLFARLGHGHCPKCGRPIAAQSREQILGRILALPTGTNVMLLAPMVREQKGEFKDFFAEMIRRGYVRARVDGNIVRLADQIALDRQLRHTIEIVVDRIKMDDKVRPRVAEAVEQTLSLSGGSVIVVHELETGGELMLSSQYACTDCELSFEPPSPQIFSFNSPQGMCLTCDGLGESRSFDPDLLVPNDSLSVAEGALVTIGPLKKIGRWRRHLFEGVAKTVGFSLNTAWKDLDPASRQALLYGTGKRNITFRWRNRLHGGIWEGVIPPMLEKYKKTTSSMHRAMFEKYMRHMKCPDCQGARLNPQARSVQVVGKTLVEMGSMAVGDLARVFDGMLAQCSDVEKIIATELVKEIRTRLGFLLDVGLEYLSLDRTAPTLSGGELQRIRLAGQIGSGLVGVMYVLDEPSIGLHPRDNGRLLATLARLRDAGNTVIVVEHDEDTMRAADMIVDFGPGPGVRGGEIVASGSLGDIESCERSLTGKFLSGKEQIALPKRRPISTSPMVPPTNGPASVLMPHSPSVAKTRKPPVKKISPSNDEADSTEVEGSETLTPLQKLRALKRFRRKAP